MMYYETLFMKLVLAILLLKFGHSCTTHSHTLYVALTIQHLILTCNQALYSVNCCTRLYIV